MTDSKQSSYPPIFSVICNGNFDYLVMGSLHQYAKLNNIKDGEMIEAGSGFVVEYDSKDKDYLYVKALFQYQDKYYFVPSTYSMLGTMCIDSEWKIVHSKLEYPIQELDIQTCRVVCPGYLD